jgi:hypothetical protein
VQWKRTNRATQTGHIPQNISHILSHIVLSTDVQNWHDCNAFQLPISTARYELIDKSHFHEFYISRLTLLCGLVGCKGSLCCGVYRVCASLERQTRVQEPEGSEGAKWLQQYMEELHNTCIANSVFEGALCRRLGIPNLPTGAPGVTCACYIPLSSTNPDHALSCTGPRSL